VPLAHARVKVGDGRHRAIVERPWQTGNANQALRRQLCRLSPSNRESVYPQKCYSRGRFVTGFPERQQVRVAAACYQIAIPCKAFGA
jgi:hypothetical protein